MGSEKVPEMVQEKKIFSRSQNSKSNLSEILRKLFAEGQALTGIRAAIHRHLTCAPLSRNIKILQDSKFMSANKMFEAKAKLFTKENNAKPKHKSSVQ